MALGILAQHQRARLSGHLLEPYLQSQVRSQTEVLDQVIATG